MSEPNNNLESNIVKTIVDAYASAKPVRIQSGIGRNTRYFSTDDII